MSWQGFLPENAIVMARLGTATQRVVNQSPLLMFVGEKLNEQEEQLLNKMIEAMGLSREQILLTDIAGLRPPFTPVIVALGESAAQVLRGTELPPEVKLMSTFHPSHLIQNPSSKKEAWTVLQLVAKELGIEIPKRKDT